MDAGSVPPHIAAVTRNQGPMPLSRGGQARRDDVAALPDSVHYACQLLSDLGPAEETIAAILAKLASEDGPELAGEQRHLAREALASARSARNRARALRRLAQEGRQWLPDSQSARHGGSRT